MEPLPCEYIKRTDCAGFGTEVYINGMLFVAVLNTNKFCLGNVYFYFLWGSAKFFNKGSRRFNDFTSLNFIGSGSFVSTEQTFLLGISS